MRFTKEKLKIVSNNEAVSPIIGTILMLGIVVIGVSIVTVSILSFQQSQQPTQQMDINVDAWVDEKSNTIHLKHDGGNPVNIKNLKLIVNIDGKRKEISSGNLSKVYDKDKWEAADTITLTSSEFGKQISKDSYVESTVVHKNSGTLVFNGILLGKKPTVRNNTSNIKPVADFIYNPSEPDTSDTIQFDGKSSYDQDGNIQKYQWNFGDGSSNKTGLTTTHSYDNSGTYSVTLTVEDNKGKTDTIEKQVNVAEHGDIEDPGFAYEDRNHNKQFDNIDLRIPNPEIHDGEYDATINDSSLVIPPSVGDISANFIDFKGENISIHVNLSAVVYNGDAILDAKRSIDIEDIRIETQGYDEPIYLNADNSIIANNITLISNGKIKLIANNDIKFTESYMDTVSYGMDTSVKSKNGTIDLSNTRIVPDGNVLIDSQKGLNATNIDIDGYRSGQGIDFLKLISKNNIDISKGNVTSKVDIIINSQKKLIATNSNIKTTQYGMKIDFTSNNDMNLSSSNINSMGPVIIDSNNLLAAYNTNIDTSNANGMEVDLKSNNDIDIVQSNLTAKANIYVDATNKINMNKSKLTATSYGHQIRVKSNNVVINKSNLVANYYVYLLSNNDINVDQSDIDANDLIIVYSYNNINVNRSELIAQSYYYNTYVYAHNAVDITQSELIANSDVYIKATGNQLDATGTIIDTSNQWNKNIILESAEDMYLKDSSLITNNGYLRASITGTPPNAKYIYINNAKFKDNNDKLDINPNSVNVIPENSNIVE